MENINYKKGNLTLILCGVIAILVVVLFMKGCNGSAETIKVKIPSIVGTTPIVKPESKLITIHDTIFKLIRQNLSNKELLYWQNEAERLHVEYDKLDNAYANANDSLQQIIYRSQIEPKEFNHTWDNDTIKAIVFGMNRGEITAIQLKYEVKERKQEIKVPTVRFRLLGGVEAGITKSFDKFNAKVNLGFQNAKGNIVSVSADSEQRFYLGYAFSIFSIKK